MKKVGIDFFPYPSTNDVNVTTILGDFGAMGVYAYTILLQVIYKDKGFYFEPNKRNLSTLRLLGGIDRDSNIIEEVIETALELGLFDNEKYKEFGILTSEEIQFNYFVAVRKRKDVEINKEFLIGKNIKTYEEIVEKSKSEKTEKSGLKEKTAEFLAKTAEENGKTAEDLNRKYNIIGENKIEENKIEENKLSKKVFFERENRIGESISGEENLSQKEQLKLNKNQINLKSYGECGESDLNGESVCCCEIVDNKGKVGDLGIDADYSIIVQDKGQVSGSEFSEVVKSGGYRKLSNEEVIMFNEEFAGKHIKEANYIVSEGFDMGAFIEEIKRSDFLTQLPNLSFDWLVKHYGVVMNGNYRKFKKKAEEEKFDMNAYLDSL